MGKHRIFRRALQRATQTVAPKHAPRIRIFVAVPTEHCQITTPIAAMMNDAVVISMTPNRPFEFEFAFVNDKHPTEYARNLLCDMFLKSQSHAIWFVDSDTLPCKNGVSFKLLDVDADIVAGVYPINRQDKGNAVLAIDWGFYNQVEGGWRPIPVDAYRNGEIVQCDGAATGCMLIKRHVIEHYANKEPKDKDGVSAIFRWPRECTGHGMTSDDLDFCARAKADGFTLKVHTGVRWGHIKLKDLSDTYEQLKRAFMEGYQEAVEDHGNPENISADSAV